jgi:hypothetical protein
LLNTSTKNQLSTLIIGVFTFVLVLAAFVSEFFQAPTSTSQELTKLQYLFNDKDIKNIEVLSLQTGLVDFTVKNESGHWIMTSPREIDANDETIGQILESLRNIRIKKIYPRDEINKANFSLNNPLSKVTLTYPDTKKRVLSFGLVNPINNTTYVSLDSEDAIYHVNLLSFRFEKTELANVIDSRIFSSTAKEVARLQISSRDSKTLDIEKNKNIWYSGKRQLQSEKVETYLNELLSIKSAVILDRKTDRLSKKLSSYLDRPYFKMTLQNNKGEEITYDVSFIVNSLPDINIERKQNFIIRASNRKHPFLVHKNYMKHFYKKASSFKTLSIKKIIY